jgi:hypothetical protein
MAKTIRYKFVGNKRKKRPGRHSKNASVGQTGWKKKYNGQGK